MITEHHEHKTRCFWNPAEARWDCGGQLAHTSVEPGLVDVRDMVVVHTALLREFRLAPAAVLRTEPGDRKQARAVAGHLRFVCAMLHHHHAGEDALLWPVLRERTAAASAALIDEVEAQHEALDTSLQGVAAALEQWADVPDAANRDVLASRLGELSALLRDHLDLEEQALLPLAAAALTGPEWQAIGAAGAASMSKPELALAFGMFAYEGDPAVVASMLSAAPAVPRLVLPRVAPRIYARRSRRVHGTARP